MYIEIKIALNFLLSYLYDRLPRRRVNLFGEELEKYIGQKLMLTDWQQQQQTSSLIEAHALTINKQEVYVDVCVVSAATESALDLKEILAQLPPYLKLFIEPGLVAYLLEPPPLLSQSFATADVSSSAAQFDLKILYKLPNIDVSTLTYVNSASGSFLKG